MARMNDSGENRKEATCRKLEVLSPKTKTRIGFWNVRSIYETGKIVQVTAEMRRYSLHRSRSRRVQVDRIRKREDQIRETVLYAGRDDYQHHKGVAIVLKKGMEVSARVENN